MKTIGHILYVVVRFVVRTMLAFDRKVLKRFLNLETPLYKFWWSNHVEHIQKKLNEAHILRENESLFYEVA